MDKSWPFVLAMRPAVRTRLQRISNSVRILDQTSGSEMGKCDLVTSPHSTVWEQLPRTQQHPPQPRACHSPRAATHRASVTKTIQTAGPTLPPAHRSSAPPPRHLAYAFRDPPPGSPRPPISRVCRWDFSTTILPVLVGVPTSTSTTSSSTTAVRYMYSNPLLLMNSASRPRLWTVHVD